MHTTYVLHGGQTSKKSPHNNEFFKQFTTLVNRDEVKIIMCYWAINKKNWDRLFKRDSKKIQQQASKNKKVKLSLTNNPKELLTQLKSHDVLYVAGGDAQPIEKHLPQLSDLKKYLKNKIYIGSSMGAFIVTQQYVLSFDSQNQSVHQGLSILPIQILCHWDVENKKEEKISRLKNTVSDLPILTLDECEFVTLIQ